jgi:hypothetical protein
MAVTFYASEKQNNFSGDDSILQTFETSRVFYEFFQSFLCTNTAKFSTEAVHLPLRSAYGLWVPLTNSLKKEIGFSRNLNCTLYSSKTVVMVRDGHLSLASTTYQKRVRKICRSWPFYKLSTRDFCFCDSFRQQSAAMRTRFAYF